METNRVFKIALAKSFSKTPMYAFIEVPGRSALKVKGET